MYSHKSVLKLIYDDYCARYISLKCKKLFKRPYRYTLQVAKLIQLNTKRKVSTISGQLALPRMRIRPRG